MRPRNRQARQPVNRRRDITTGEKREESKAGYTRPNRGNIRNSVRRRLSSLSGQAPKRLDSIPCPTLALSISDINIRRAYSQKGLAVYRICVVQANLGTGQKSRSPNKDTRTAKRHSHTARRKASKGMTRMEKGKRDQGPCRQLVYTVATATFCSQQ